MLHSPVTRTIKQERYVYEPVPAGFLIHWTDAYPGSVSNSDITEQFQALDYVRKDKTFMTDKGFNITAPYHQGGLLETRTSTKFNSQFVETETVKVDQVLFSDLSQVHVRLICYFRDWN